MGDIYYIKNNVNNKIYIGLTEVGIKKRCIQHYSSLRHNNHTNDHLQKAWNKYGELSFSTGSFESNIDSIEELNRLEIEYIKKYNSIDQDFGYNQRDGGEAGGKPTEEVRKKMSEWQKGRVALNKGSRMSEEQKKKLSIAHKGKILSKEHKIKISESLLGNSRSKGRILSIDHINALREGHKKYFKQLKKENI